VTQDRVANDLLTEQVEYYRACATEYDQWWERRGRYDRGAEATARWKHERAQLFDALNAMQLRGDVLELAAGTGIWTERLVRTAQSVTVVDASPEMLKINQARLGRLAETVSYTVADLFAWSPPRQFDAVVFCFWISHVPEARLDRFISMVRDALHAEGRAFFVDSKRDPTSTADDHQLPAQEQEVMVRRLNDGSEYRVIKAFRSPFEIEHRARKQGLVVSVTETETYFQYGVGRKA